jgi:hypothetical protein
VEAPARWECALWLRVKAALEAAGKTRTSYYLMADEAVRLCKLKRHG